MKNGKITRKTEQEALNSIPAETGELSEEDLDGVAGGNFVRKIREAATAPNAIIVEHGLNPLGEKALPNNKGTNSILIGL